MGAVKDYVVRHFRHFNSATVVDAARAWEELLARGGRMFLSMGGAMSTAELGTVLAELIRRDKLHAMCVTGANLEEDVFNLVARSEYRRLPAYRELSPQDEKALYDQGFSRVTDTCIPEEAAMRKIESHMLELWCAAESGGERHAPHEYLYRLLRSDVLRSQYQSDPRDSWMLAAAQRNLPLFVPGWEDSTLGNFFVASVIRGRLRGHTAVKSGLEQMQELVQWYRAIDSEHRVGFFQIGGGISGDFPICVVPLITKDLKWPVKTWSYFCQISEAQTSFGSYSGAPPTEKITWGKLELDTPRFVIESDATVVFPLIAGYLLDA